MGKYTYSDAMDFGDTSEKFWLANIANELAEANRLKIIELKHIIGMHNNIKYELNEDELEDKV